MKRTILAVALVLAVAATLATPGYAGRRNGASLTCSQYGVETLQIQTNSDFQISGAGFRTYSPAWVCVVGFRCIRSEVDPFGSFSQVRTLSSPGTYTVNVYQWKNQQGTMSELVATGAMTLVDR